MRSSDRSIYLFLSLALGVLLIIGCAQQKGGEQGTPQEEREESPSDTSAARTQKPSRPTLPPDFKDQDVELTGNERGVIEMEKGGKIVIQFFPEDAPNTVKNFIKLARVGFYDGVVFHRVVPGFVVQGGDPTGTGLSGPGYTIDAEFNKRRHLKGSVAMARSEDPNSAGSQFYICLEAQPHLDGNYTVFGQVIEGMDVVTKIRQGDRMKSVVIVQKGES
jgi:cyclophilin family peptidyl-prolyl cis-trans isomerase